MRPPFLPPRHSPSETELPWTFAVIAASDATIVVLLAGGSALVWRVTQRELAVARLQTEFAAAVSHEFRTTLASLRHAR
jgi:signal transduction histidine kinase